MSIKATEPAESKLEALFFQRKRFITAKMEVFGFRKTEAGYEYTSDFMNGEFQATVFVSDTGAVRGKVIDKMNEEEYQPLRAGGMNGAYVNAVRNAYRAVLEQIAEGCCTEVLFVSEQANRIAERIWALYSVKPYFPWSENQYPRCGTFRHAENDKWFALILHIRWDSLLKNGDTGTTDIINLKTDPMHADESGKSNGIYPGYHMNHQKWISVVLNDTLTDDAIMAMVETSFRLTKGKKG